MLFFPDTFHAIYPLQAVSRLQCREVWYVRDIFRTQPGNIWFCDKINYPYISDLKSQTSIRVPRYSDVSYGLTIVNRIKIFISCRNKSRLKRPCYAAVTAASKAETGTFPPPAALKRRQLSPVVGGHTSVPGWLAGLSTRPLRNGYLMGVACAHFSQLPYS